MKRAEHLTELMDDPGCPPDETARALDFLSRLNRAAGAHRLFCGLARGDRVLDVAGGGGDVAGELLRAGAAREVVSLDLGRPALRYSRAHHPEVVGVRGDALRLPFPDGTFDAAVSHLFFHHLTESEIVTVLREMARVARRVVILDLERSRKLWLAVWVATRFSGSRLARHDGPVSVRRAYTVGDMTGILREAGMAGVVRRGPWGRWCLVARGRAPAGRPEAETATLAATAPAIKKGPEG